MAINLTKGVFRFTTGTLDKERYIISTPNAGLGIRGTVLDIGVEGAQSKVTLVEGQALVCPRRPGITFAQQIRNCTHCRTRAALRVHRPQQRRPDGAGQEVGRRQPGEPDLDAGRFRLELRGRRRALLGQHICVRHHSGRRRRLSSRGPMRTMRPERAPRASWLLASTSAATLVCWSGAAFAACVSNPGGVLAGPGDTCFVSGSFATAVDDAILAQATGVGALISGPAVGPISFSTTGAASNALQADTGGAINLTPTLAAPGTVTTSGAGSFGLFATGSGEGAGGPVASHINAFNLSVSTTGPDAFGAVATNGAFVSLTGGSVMVSGDGSIGVNSNGAGSTVQASGVAVTTSGGVDSETGNTPVGVLAFNGGTITFAGGSITTTGASADAVASDGSGSSIALSGGTTILTTNNGSAGLVVVGSGAAATATGIAITTHGDEDTSDGFIPAGAYNGQDAADGFPNGGTMQLTNTVILTTGSNAPGVDTNSGGVTTISGGSVNTTGQDSRALFVSGSGSKANLAGAGSFSTAGAGAIGLAASQGGVISATGSISVTTAGGVSPATGFPAAGVAADGAGSAINLAAANITTSGPGAFGLVASDVLASGAAGTITASRDAERSDERPLGGGSRAAGQWRDDNSDRRRDDHRSWKRDCVHGRDRPDRDFRRFLHRQPVGRPRLRRPLDRDAQFQRHHRKRRKQQSAQRNGRQRDYAQRQRLDAHRGDPHRRRFDLQRQPHEQHDVEPDRAVDCHQPQRHPQHHRLRSARLGRRLQDADGQQLCRERREHRHERGAGRVRFRRRPDHHQRRKGHRLELC